MADQGSVAPKERVNIVYKSTVGDQTEEVELPLKLMVVGDYTGRPNDDVLEEIEPKNINKDNFDDVMRSYDLNVNLNVTNRLEEGEEGSELPVSLKFDGMKDFSPDSIAHQVPELHQLLELRRALLALKGPLGNVPSFRKSIQSILGDDGSRAKLMGELGLEAGDK